MNRLARYWRILGERLPASDCHGNAVRPTPSRIALALCAALGSMLFVVLLYWPGVSIPVLAEGIVEQQLAETSPTHYLMRSAYGEEGSGVYYRFGTRLIDHAVQQLAGGPDAITDFFNQVWQLAIHALCVGLVFLLVFQQTGNRVIPALVAALLFGAHPSITAAVLYVSVRWNTSILVVFLIMANIYQFAFRPSRASPPRLLFVALAPFVLFLAMIAEIGALAMGVLGLWLLVMCLARRDIKWGLWCLGPLAPVPLFYLLIRRISIGSVASSYVDVSYTPVERVSVYMMNLVYDATLLINPIRFSFLTAPGSPRSWLLLSALTVMVALVALFLWKPFRAALVRCPLPVIGLGLFLLFQLNALWLIPKSPISISGIDRGYVYYFPVAMFAILAGNLVAFFLVAEKSTGLRAILAAGAVAFLLAAAGAVRESVQLWRDGGHIVTENERQLRPFLEQLPEGSQIYMQGFPDALREPYMPWVLVYYFTHQHFAEKWAGKPLQVWNDSFHSSIPEGFDGWLIVNEGAEVSWKRLSSSDARRTFEAARQASEVDVPPIDILRELRRETMNPILSALSMEEPVDSTEQAVRFMASSHDPWAYLEPGLGSLEYGRLRLELRFPEPGQFPRNIVSQVYFRPPGHDFREFHSMSVTLSPSTQWQEVVFPLHTNPLWVSMGSIEALRLDFVDHPGTFETRNVILDAPP